MLTHEKKYTIEMQRGLLTPQEVADILKTSVRTIYDHARKLGGFYPYGIKLLRFRAGDIYDGLERQNIQILGVSVSTSGPEVRGKGLRHAEGRRGWGIQTAGGRNKAGQGDLSGVGKYGF